ncbi:HAD family hydrolase [Longimicrobium sp.]|uniref:D-glycero-alpha-D-manno-heptose-1,7-bisphosphate 7-phosphatase n=1 Tax=Longimicrobium sp. TaxID=2029185 RepID=UPI002CC2A5D7|nr:HAD family hydrolase [Longimicrobium sp.]HSU13690.1 HAD family hydrolase [Longimicrobium sp.]
MADAARRAVFVDRDGTLIEDRHYLADPAGVALLPGAAEAVRRLNEAGWLVVLVTNQSGIGRGMFGEDDYAAVHRRLVELLAAEGARLDAEYHCPLAPGDPDPHHLRKPGAGMYLRAADEHGIGLARSWLVGDRVRDVAAARELGASALLVRSPQTEVDEAERLGIPILPSLLDIIPRL